ncbi:hypothetical protein LCGC14_2838420 [marine sediment metagenome]|uniref:Uncharacterized protein n=1 Tax=marine sediment metagenome TaxID=412755 RepID=A0A0F9B329_9ZZZZ
MIKARLERLKKLCSLKLEKNHKFTMKQWMSISKPQLGVKCNTAGCLASIMSFDPFFKEIGFEMTNRKVIATTSMVIPCFNGFLAMEAMSVLFDLSSGQSLFIFGGQNPDSLAAAICRIDAVLDGKKRFTNEELGIRLEY